MNKTLKSALLSAAVLLVGSTAFASNMGFKLVYPLNTVSAGVHDGTNWVSIPYFNSFTPTQDAAAMWADLPAAKQNIYRYDPVSSVFRRYSGGGPGQTNFAVTSGEAYLFNVTANANWTIVGSHDNALAKSLSTVSAGVHDGTNWTGVPYHTNKTDAAGLWSELPAAKQNIYRYDPAASVFRRYSGGGPGQTNFAVTIGEAYLINVTANATWTPAHY
jgi:hypothetical protein